MECEGLSYEYSEPESLCGIGCNRFVSCDVSKLYKFNSIVHTCLEGAVWSNNECLRCDRSLIFVNKIMFTILQYYYNWSVLTFILNFYNQFYLANNVHLSKFYYKAKHLV